MNEGRVPWNKGLTGLPANRPKNGTDKTCDTCGKSFYVRPSAPNKHYCSHECYYKGRWGPEHRVSGNCIICGTAFTDFACKKRRSCSTACSREIVSREKRGELCRFWRGGKVAPYCNDWKAARRLALERDGHQCVICKSKDRLQAHHKIPYRYCHNHDLDNLICLCRSHHSREEFKINPAMANGLLQRWAKKNAPGTTITPISPFSV